MNRYTEFIFDWLNTYIKFYELTEIAFQSYFIETKPTKLGFSKQHYTRLMFIVRGHKLSNNDTLECEVYDEMPLLAVYRALKKIETMNIDTNINHELFAKALLEEVA